MRFPVLFLALMLLLLPQSAVAAWHEAKSRHFIIYSEQRPAELRRFAEELERFDQAIRRLRSMDDPALSDSGKLTIFVLPSQAAVANLIDRRGGVAGAYIGRAAGAVAFVHRERETGRATELTAQTVLFHEYVHHLMLSQADFSYPAWVVEGAAEFFSTAEILKDGAVQIGRVPAHRAYGLLRLTGLSTEQMVGAMSGRMTDAQRELLYGRGWLLYHYLMFEPTRRGQIDTYLRAIGSGQSALASARQAFGDLQQLDRELNRYLEARRLTAVTVAASALTVGPVDIRPLSAAEDAIMPVRIRSARGVNRETAQAVVQMARKVAADFPADADVLAALAEAEYDAGNFPAALAAAEKASAVRPNFAHALIYQGRALLQIGRAAPAVADWKAIRAVLGRANRLDPDDAEPLMLFYQTFRAQGIVPTANALDGLVYAQRLAPQDDGLRLLTVRALLAANKLPEARIVFAPIINDPHRSRWSDHWVAVQAAIDGGNAGGALTLLEQQEREFQASREEQRRR